MNSYIPASSYCKKIFDGTHDTPKSVKSGIPLITSKNITGNILNLKDTYNISEEDYLAIQNRSKVSQWDILFSMIGTIGETYIEKKTEISYAIKNIGVFSCNDEYEAKWLYYYLKSPQAKKFINNYLNGAVQKFLPLGTLRNFPVIPFKNKYIPYINLLEDLDAKIELNNRINAELKYLAKTLYDYWFVQFDFPNAQGTPYKASGGELIWNDKLKRKIPLGWKVHEVGNILETSLGGTPPTSNVSYWKNGTINWLSSGEVNNFPILNTELKITEEALNNSATKLMPKGTVAISITRYIRPTILAIDSCANQSVVGIHESSIFKCSYLYPFFVNEVSRYMVIRTGAMQPHINKETIKSTPIIEPNNYVLNEYYKISNPIYQVIVNNAKENQELIQLRDFLLPLLMSGQVIMK